MKAPIYTTIDSVKVRLEGKVQFQTENPPLDGEIPDALLIQLIMDAETDVEQDLRSRYAIPLQSKCHGNFKSLPDHSQRAIRTLMDYMCVIKVMETDFGRGSHINADGYIDNDRRHYRELLEKLLGKDMQGDGANRFKYSPPLDDVKLSASNRAADDGYRGMIINTDASQNDSVSYAEDSINNPAQTFNKRRLRGTGGL